MLLAVRAVFVASLSMEVPNCFKFLSVIAIWLLRSVQACHYLLLYQLVSEFTFGELIQVKVLASYILDWPAFHFCTYLATGFVVMLVCISGLGTMMNKVPWYSYSIGFLVTFITHTFITVLLYLVVCVDQVRSLWLVALLVATKL